MRDLAQVVNVGNWSDVAAPPTWQELGALFKDERTRRHESLRAVAAATGVPVSTLSSFELRKNEPGASVFIAVWAWIAAGR